MKLILLNFQNGLFIDLIDFPQNKKVFKLKKNFQGNGAYPIVTFIGEGPKFSFPK